MRKLRILHSKKDHHTIINFLYFATSTVKISHHRNTARCFSTNTAYVMPKSRKNFIRFHTKLKTFFKRKWELEQFKECYTSRDNNAAQGNYDMRLQTELNIFKHYLKLYITSGIRNAETKRYRYIQRIYICTETRRS